MISHISIEGDLELTRQWYQFLIELLPALSNPEFHYSLSRKSLDYLRALTNLVIRKAKRHPALEDTDRALLASVLEAMSKHPNIEQSSASDVDETITGLLDVTRAFLTSYPQLRSEIGASLLDEVFHRNLFDIPTVNEEGKVPPPRCKTAQSRNSALCVLLELATGSNDLMTRLCEKTLALYETQAFTSHWDYLPSVSEKSSCGLTGLCNLGATCYMNSLMQQLHMNSQFRHRIFSVQDKEEDKKNSVLFQLQSIFSHLQESVLKYYDPTPFCNIYKIYGDEAMNPLVQMDVDEFFANIMDKIETMLKGSEQEKMLKEFFGGEVVNQIIPTECPHVVERTEPFLNLSLEVKNKYQLEHCLDLYIQGDMLEGDNKFHCSTCESKVTALKRCCINTLPHFLIIHLKRFDFDLELMRRSKINQFCSFPQELNVEPYTKEGLARREQREGSEELPSHPASFFDYTLTGILVHQGTTEFGHYYSFIKDRETGHWYKFNDSQVTPFNYNNIAEECFGGTYTTDAWDPQHRKWVTMNHTRTNNAYMLFYERCHPEKEIPLVTPNDLRQSVPRELYDEIWKENVTFLRDKCLFDKSFTYFTTSVCS
jgi:ubiquitin carboxyl-terminal hydrolase 34